MKPAPIIVLLCLYALIGVAQTGLTKEQKLLILQNNAAIRPTSVPTLHRKESIPGIRIAAETLLNPGKLKEVAKKIPADIRIPALKGNQFDALQKEEGLCADSSFRRLLGVFNGQIYLQSINQTADHGILVSTLMYDSTRLPYPSWRTFGLLLKLDEAGNIKWIKQFEDKNPGSFSTIYIAKAFELANHDIIAVGLQKNDPNSSVYRTIVYRLNASGNIIWQNSLQSTLSMFNNTSGSFTYFVESAMDGYNGDVILTGTSSSGASYGNVETVTRLNNSGAIVWDANYGNHGVDGSYRFGAEGVSTFLKNGNIELVGISHGGNIILQTPAINFFTLDYNTGNLINKRFFRIDEPDQDIAFQKSFTHYYNKFIRLSNGHSLFYGKLYSDYLKSTPVIHYFGVVEFDQDLNFIKAYTINSQLKTSYFNNLLEFDVSGKGLVAVYNFIEENSSDVFIGAFEGLQFQHQRKAHYSKEILPGNTGFAFLQDNGFALLQSYFEDIPNTNTDLSYIEFRKMHISDTASKCLGTDTSLFDFQPIVMLEDPDYYYWDPNEPNLMNAYPQNISQTDTISTSNRYLCLQQNLCDTVKIHGNPIVCAGNPSVVYSAFKHEACGAIVQWDIDQNAIDSFKVITDTSVRIWFKNINWQGKLYASISSGACFLPIRDSFSISLSGLPALSLGVDTALCNKNELVLHAGNWFSGYKWQDGSSDSLFRVREPGIYYVTVKDYCSIAVSDTIIIKAAVFPFSIGPDRIRCNNDTLQLNATPGFNNYKWNVNYNISADTGISVNVYPTADTIYYATAEKWPGCVVSDTMHIRVLNSPAINLGKDTSLCIGQMLRLDAGAGFDHYLWNNGSIDQQLNIYQAGMYAVKAFAANGCISQDTLSILNISPVPAFSLGADTTICTGNVYRYFFNLPAATYLWQDGNTGNNYTIDKPGQYILGITQTGCTAIDTVVIQYKESPVVYLGQDTSICSGSNYQLNAFIQGATYKWQDGSDLAYFNVSQSGRYSVSVDLNGCIAADTQAVSTIPFPEFTLGNDTVICEGRSIILKPLLNTAVTYNWQDGSSSATYEVTRPAMIGLTVMNTCGTYADSILVRAGLCKLIMPNSFTPNGDGINDVFRVKNPFSVKSFRFMIYNRFGEKIFETTDMREGWNGTYKFLKQNSGTYVWQIRIIGLDGEVENQHGSVILLR